MIIEKIPPCVVTREKDSPTVAHSGRKRRPKFLDGAWANSWATLPRGLQVWWTGPPGWGLGNKSTTCHRKKKLTVWKPKLWSPNRLSGIDLGSGKGLMR